jgi:hypothetical protein
MRRTTPKPCRDVLEVLPELAGRAVATVRFHPRPGRVPEPGASKFGGTFLWPRDEPWPVCDEHPDRQPDEAEPILIPVLQLRAADFPELQFYAGTDLFQLLWCHPRISGYSGSNTRDLLGSWRGTGQGGAAGSCGGRGTKPRPQSGTRESGKRAEPPPAGDLCVRTRTEATG